MSFAHRTLTSLSLKQEYVDVFTKVRSKGVLLFGAAGNQGENVNAEICLLGTCVETHFFSPCQIDAVICVGGLQRNSKLRYTDEKGGSNYGRKDVNLYAPYLVLVGPDPSDNGVNKAKLAGGTSVASPYAAGVAALIWAANPHLSADQVEGILSSTAHLSPDPLVGRYVNAFAAAMKALGNDILFFTAQPSPVNIGQIITFSWEVASPGGGTFTCSLNPGDGSSTHTITNCTNYFSQNHAYNTAGTFTATLNVSDGAGGLSRKTLEIVVGESSEKSDLVIENLTVNPTSGAAGSSATVSFTIRNQGDGEALASTTNIRINSNPSIPTVNDPLLASISTPSIPAGGTHPITRSVTIPSGLELGTYYIWVIADVGSTANQSDESNDRERATFTIADDNSYIWLRELGGGSVWPGGVAVDSGSNAYVVGDTWGTFPGQTNPGPGGYESSAFIAKYDGNGNQVWVRQFAKGHASDVAVDSSDNAYVVGGIYVGPDPSCSFGCVGRSDGFIAKYDSNGNQAWLRELGAGGHVGVTRVALGSGDNIYVVGRTAGTFLGQTGGGAFIAKYDGNGNRVWVRQFGTGLYDIARDVAVDSDNNAYVVGYIGWSDAVIVKYDSNGNQVSMTDFGVGSMAHVTVDSSDNLYLVRNYYRAGFTSSYILIAKHDRDGNQVSVDHRLA
jgi:hypothetical protein